MHLVMWTAYNFEHSFTIWGRFQSS